MTANYLAGKRIQGSSSTSVSGNYTGWKEFSRHTLSSSTDLIRVSSLPQSRFFMVLAHIIPANNSALVSHIRLDGEGGSNYAPRRLYTTSGSTMTEEGGSATNRFFTTHSDKTIENGGGRFITFFMANPETKDKFLIGRCTESNTTGTNTDCLTMIHGTGRTFAGGGSFDNTWSQSIDIVDDEAGQFGSGSELVVLEYDPDQTDTSGQFWEQLADVELSSDGDIIDSGVFTAKKYLWFQIYKKTESGSPVMKLRFNNDSTADIYRRIAQENGGTVYRDDDTNFLPAFGNGDEFINGYVLNSASKEKLTHGDLVWSNSNGSIPQRWRWAGKYATNTQVTRIQADNSNSGNSNFATGSWIKVWGHD